MEKGIFKPHDCVRIRPPIFLYACCPLGRIVGKIIQHRGHAIDRDNLLTILTDLTRQYNGTTKVKYERSTIYYRHFTHTYTNTQTPEIGPTAIKIYFTASTLLSNFTLGCYMRTFCYPIYPNNSISNQFQINTKTSRTCIFPSSNSSQLP
jgi:hypothetical protein